MNSNRPALNQFPGFDALGNSCAPGSAGCNVLATKKFTASLNFIPINEKLAKATTRVSVQSVRGTGYALALASRVDESVP